MKWFFKSPLRVFSSITFILPIMTAIVMLYYWNWYAVPIILIYGVGGILVYFSIFLPPESLAAASWKVFLKGYPTAIRTFWQEFMRD